MISNAHCSGLYEPAGVGFQARNPGGVDYVRGYAMPLRQECSLPFFRENPGRQKARGIDTLSEGVFLGGLPRLDGP